MRPQDSSRAGRPVNVVLLGPPAAGKGTQAELLVERYGMVHISTGDLLRARAKFLPELARCMSSGELVPDDVVSSLLKERLADRDCGTQGVLLDGFPRTRAQAESLETAGVCITAVIHLQVADDVVMERIAGRRIDPLSGKIYHVTDNPPPREVAGRVIQREDDTESKIRRRLVAYHAERDAIVAFYGDRVKGISVGGALPSALPANVRPMMVFDEVRKALEGDTYWGSVVRSSVVAKAFECGTQSRALVSVAQFFEHSRFRLVRNGCLADAASRAEHVALRAQVVRLATHLQPLAEYELRAWLERVSSHSVVVGHAISRRLANGDVVDVGRGSAALVFIGQQGEAIEVPDAARLRELAAPATALRGHNPVNDVHVASPEVMAELIGPMPASSRCIALCVPAVDLDVSGRVHESACISCFERLRFSAASEGAYPAGVNERVLRARTVRAYVAYTGFAGQADRLEAFTWAFEPRGASSAQGRTFNLAFEVRPSRGSGGAPLLRGWLVLEVGEERGNGPLAAKL